MGILKRIKRHHDWDPVDKKLELGETLGTGTGESENAVQIGGWAGTDDATSTAPSDMPVESDDEDTLEGMHIIQAEDLEESPDSKNPESRHNHGVEEA